MSLNSLIFFNILISNTDDHLRKHGFLFSCQGGWRSDTAYDLNPVPIDIRPRVLTTAIDQALSVAGYFELNQTDARSIAAEVGRAVAGWRDQALRLRENAAEIDRTALAFEYEDSRGCSF